MRGAAAAVAAAAAQYFVMFLAAMPGSTGRGTQFRHRVHVELAKEVDGRRTTIA
jgi:hypothetical protein